MNIGKAMAIFLQIENEEYSDEEKTIAIYLVMNMTTHNSIKKEDMLKALKWLWHSAYAFKVEKPAGCENCVFYDEDVDNQPCCSCNDFSNFEQAHPTEKVGAEQCRKMR